MNPQGALSWSRGIICIENSLPEPLAISSNIWDEQVLSHFKTNQVIEAVITQIHYFSPGPPDACAYPGTLL